jgi:hypothetical protein
MRNLTLCLLLVSAFALAGCEAKVGSERWCKNLSDKPKSEWSLTEARDYAAHCLIDSTTIGSEAWCEKMDEKDKGDWTASEAADYAKHCVVR